MTAHDLTVAIIPARGGSKGVPGKNLRRVGGMPLIERAVRATTASGVDLVVVSTDDPAIGAAARAAGARIVERPDHLGGDTASSESAVLHALDVLVHDGIRVGTVVFVQATSPFISGDSIAEAVAAAIAPLLTPPDTRIAASALVTDFDGVHTDDTATVDSDGRESVRVSREDGMGVSRLRRAGIPMLILSTEQNPVVARRAEKLRVPVLHGVDDKAAALAAWAGEHGIALADIAYVGNDVNDLGPLGIVGWPIAVANAHPEVKRVARVLLSRRGGEGAVREVIERMLVS